MSHVIATIAVQMKTGQFPRRALARIGGVPVLRWLVDRLRLAERIDEIVILTSTRPEDAILFELARDWGVSAFLGPAEDTLSRYRKAAECHDASHIVRVQGSNLLTEPYYVDRMVEHAIDEKLDYVRTGGLPLGVSAEVIARDTLDLLQYDLPEPQPAEPTLFWAFDPARYRCGVLQAHESIQRPDYSLMVRTRADLERMRTLFSRCPMGQGGPDLPDVIRLLDETEEKRDTLSGHAEERERPTASV